MLEKLLRLFRRPRVELTPWEEAARLEAKRLEDENTTLRVSETGRGFGDPSRAPRIP